jgi:hypothetical protein
MNTSDIGSAKRLHERGGHLLLDRCGICSVSAIVGTIWPVFDVVGRDSLVGLVVTKTASFDTADLVRTIRLAV